MLLTGCTVWYAGRKPTKIAVESSPVEALGYRVVASVRKRHKTRKGSLIVRMALEQLTRNKKKTMVTMLSLAASLSVFLCLITLLHTQSAREYSYNYMGLDMVLKNDTINNMVLNRAAEGEEQIQGVHPILNEELLNEIRQTDGVEEVLPTITVPTIVPWEKEVTDCLLYTSMGSGAVCRGWICTCSRKRSFFQGASELQSRGTGGSRWPDI